MSKALKPPTEEPANQPTEQPLTIEELQATTTTDVKALVKLNQTDPGLSLRKKAKILNISHVTVKKLQDKLDIIQVHSVKFKENRADILADAQRRILNVALTDEQIKDMGHRDRAVWYGILSDKEHREREKSQSPQAFMIHVRDIHILINKGQAVPESPFKPSQKVSGPQTGQIIDVKPILKDARALIEPIPQHIEVSETDIPLEDRNPLENKDSDDNSSA